MFSPVKVAALFAFAGVLAGSQGSLWGGQKSLAGRPAASIAPLVTKPAGLGSNRFTTDSREARVKILKIKAAAQVAPRVEINRLVVAKPAEALRQVSALTPSTGEKK